MTAGRICCREVSFADPNEPVRAAARRLEEHGVGCLVVLGGRRAPVGVLTDRDLALRVVADGRDPESTRVREVMSAVPLTAHESTPIEEALDRMRRAGVRRLPVVDDEGSLAGLLTLDDVLDLLVEEASSVGGILSRQRPPKRPVGDAAPAGEGRR